MPVRLSFLMNQLSFKAFLPLNKAPLKIAARLPALSGLFLPYLCLMLKVLLISLLALSMGLRGQDSPEAWTGVRRDYYPDGRLQSVVTYEKGRVKGPYRTFNEAGNPMETGTRVMNHWVGKYYMHYENGAVRQSFTYNENGKRSGLQRYYYPGGMLHMMSKLRDDVQEGYFLEFDSLGMLEETPVYFINGTNANYENPAELQWMLEIARMENEVLMGRPRFIFSPLSE